MYNLTKEFNVFKQQPHNMRVLLITNLLFALVLPIVEIFVGAYIMRNTGSPTFVAIYQLAMYAGIVISSVINGELLKYFKIKTLYSFGILVSGLSMLVMMSMNSTGQLALIIAGLAMGLAAGFFWTNRYLLALEATDDNNRNYFFGLESFFFSICAIIVPLTVGAFLAQSSAAGIFGVKLDINVAYRIVTGVVFIITVIACFVLAKGTFVNPEQKEYLYFKFCNLWNKMILLAASKGLVQGFLVTAPAILVLKLVGNEGDLGLIQGIGGLLTAIIVYVLGRIAKPNQRIAIFVLGILVFFAGTLFNAFLFSAVGVIVFVLCKIFYQPLYDLAYFPIMMRTIDVVSEEERRNKYAYIMNHEIGLFLGRAIGLILFIVLATYVSEVFALKWALVIVVGIQIVSIPLSKIITKQTGN